MVSTEARLEVKAQYGELERHLEAKYSSMDQANNNDLQMMCQVYAELKRYNKLSSCLDQMQQRINRGDIFTGLRGMRHGDLTFWHAYFSSQALIEMGDYSKAVIQSLVELQFIKGQGEYAQKRGETLYMLERLGLAYALNGQQEEAERCIDELEGISTSGSYVLLTDPKYTAIARINMTLGRYDRARVAFEALNDQSHFWKTFGSLTSAVFLQLGDIWAFQDLPQNYSYFKVLLETGDAAKAKEGYDGLLKVPQIKDNGPIYWMILYDRGRIAEKEGNLKQAIEFYTKAVYVIEEQRSTINTEASKIGFVGDKQAVYHNLVNALYRNKSYEKAFEYVERAKARALVDLLAAKKEFTLKGGNEQEIRDMLVRNDSAEYEAMIEDETTDKNKTRNIHIKIREELQMKAPELASLVSVTSPEISEIQSLIPRDETLIEYYYWDKEMYAFVLSDGKLQAVRLDSGGLAEDIQTFRRLIDSPDSNQFLEISKKLYGRLFEPLERSLKKNLIVVSHGVLHYLPINALYDGKGYLIDRYSIRLMPSASAMKYLGGKKNAKAGGILSFGNPDLGNPKLDLEYAQKEALDVAGIVPRSKVFVRKEATEEVLLSYGKDYRYLHFATHGQFDPEAPLKSALLLAPDAEHNGLLTVDTIYSLNLDAELVTLSACETGLSQIANGDDLVGLTRGFLYAGSSSIVASLWKVDDLATSQLMTRFYREMDKVNKRDALRTAQLETKNKYPHPYYWASFQLTGSAN
jgi:CHAT domain-containing protein